ncbi:MAG: hypothetical protein KH121_08910, partial [Eubacterium sp.]|nr:hypothetical protein [Eubacterium sp.]
RCLNHNAKFNIFIIWYLLLVKTFFYFFQKCLYSVFHPSVLRIIKYIIENAKKAGIEAGMCGEAAGNPCMIPLLLSFGLDEFSVSPSNVLETRKNIASWSIREADEVTTSVMAMCTEKEVANYLSDYIAAKEQRSGFASQTRRI